MLINKITASLKTRIAELASTSKTGRRFTTQKGLTLVEIIVVLIILSLLFAFLARGLFSQGEKAKAKLNEIKMDKVKALIGQYQLQYNTLPSSLSSLTGCDDVQGSSCSPLADAEDVKDSWGTEYNYSTQGNQFSLKSLGSDRKQGGTGTNADQTITGP